MIDSRVVIVDNYDSFTYNLVHAIFESTGVRPSVFKNDDAEFINIMQNCSNLKDLFDLIILSPGPGNPKDDIGPVTEYLLSYYFDSPNTTVLPTLFGVCMGYEAIGAKQGINVVKAVPRHGLAWDIHVDELADAGTLFRELPLTFKQVRYHSLILDPVQMETSADLIVTSRCWDDEPCSASRLRRTFGPLLSERDAIPEWLCKLSTTTLEDTCRVSSQTLLPMSFRHRTLPVYGVQFHPESILSEQGLKLLKNICALAGVPERPIKETRSKTNQSVRSRTISRLIHTISDLSDLEWWTYEFYRQNVFSETHASVWLDSPKGSTGRWSFLAGGRIGGNSLSVYEMKEGRATLVEGQDLGIDMTITETEDFLKALVAVCDEENACSVTPLTVPCIFTVLGYEQSDGWFLIADRVVAVENENGNVFALHAVGDDGWSFDCPTRTAHTERIVTEPLIFAVADSKGSYMGKINVCKAAIEQGESYELCLTTQIVSTDARVVSLDPLEVYSHLRTMNPAHNSCFFKLGKKYLLMASPERYLKVDACTAIAQVKPIKGTRRRGRTPEEDQSIVAELASSEKDLAENLMIVDLVRNDLSTVCEKVQCPTLMKVETYAPYHQLVSTVEGQLPSRKKLTDLIFRLFPAGSMTGAPKVRSMQILEAIEGRKRGLAYSGAVGYVSPGCGGVDLAVTIRSIFFDKENHRVSLGCGGAILALSDPEEEWKEMILKAKRNLQVISTAAQAKGVLLQFSDKSESMFIRSPVMGQKRNAFVTTMRYERDKGIWLFQRHINRLWSSVGGDMSRLRDIILDSIWLQASRLNDIQEFETFCELGEGPFKGIGSMEWTQISPCLPVRACKIRISIPIGSSDDITCTISPLRYEEVKTCYVHPVRVDSADEALRRKTDDWYVPGVEQRDRALLVNELGFVTETGIANITVARKGSWSTPCVKSSACLPGTLREMLVENGHLREEDIEIDQISVVDVVYCLNALRGVFAVNLV